MHRQLVNAPEENLSQGLTAFTLPCAQQKRMRTSNALVRVNQELKRRTRVARVFPNENSLLRLVTALLVETSDECETGILYLNMKPTTHPTVIDAQTIYRKEIARPNNSFSQKSALNYPQPFPGLTPHELATHNSWLRRFRRCRVEPVLVSPSVRFPFVLA
ncbi:MAG: hypothetical protein EXS25_03795 [Pedosphaera sp.]|nr:hypothetical protein [Pedosphaera sp.]